MNVDDIGRAVADDATDHQVEMVGTDHAEHALGRDDQLPADGSVERAEHFGVEGEEIHGGWFVKGLRVVRIKMKRAKPDTKNAVLYVRVSTDQQTGENQKPDLMRLAESRGLDVVGIYEENVSARKTRPRFEAMMNDARAGKVGTVLVWALDRFGRSMIGNIQALLELDRLGVKIISVKEPWLDTSGPVRSLLCAIFGWVAEQEAVRVRERTLAGLEHARRRGVRLGRPRARVDLNLFDVLRRQGHEMTAIAKKLGVSEATLYRAIKSRLSDTNVLDGSDRAGRSGHLDGAPGEG